MIFVYPYKAGSRSARTLARAMGGKVIKTENSRFRPGPNKTIINWGATDQFPQEYIDPNVINNPTAVAMACNKASFFLIAGQSGRLPAFTSSEAEAHDWVRRGHPVMCRTVLNGHSGRGIVYAAHPDQIVHAPLYVAYKKKKTEYRVHIIGEDVVACHKKVKKPDVEVTDWKIRSHHNGFMYQRHFEDGAGMIESIQAAHEVFEYFDLDFGAIDVIWNDREHRPYVLEINTAPGLEGETVDAYAHALNTLINEG